MRQIEEQATLTRIQIAIETLHNGGYFRKALESSYRGGEKFCMRLRDAHGHVVRGGISMTSSVPHWPAP